MTDPASRITVALLIVVATGGDGTGTADVIATITNAAGDTATATVPFVKP